MIISHNANEIACRGGASWKRPDQILALELSQIRQRPPAHLTYALKSEKLEKQSVYYYTRFNSSAATAAVS